MTKPVVKKYDAAFKKQLVERYLAGGTLAALAQEAQIQPRTLSDWTKAYQKANPAVAQSTPPKAPAPKPAVKKMNPQTATSLAHSKTADAEVEQLRKDLKVALEENATLKKAMRILFASTT